MSLMGSLYVGQSGLQTGQNALNTTAHNMSNVDTVGYTRQQVQQTARTYRTLSKTNSANAYQQAGLGVQYARVKQVRDYFLDKTYRRESGRSAFYDTTYDAVGEIENLFQELEGEAFADAIKNLWESVQEIAKDPSNTVNQGVFIQRCNEFTTRAAAVYDGLCEYQDNMNYTVQQKVNQMNKYGARIAELNQQILIIDAAQVEKANDLRDERNQLTDELSKLAHINLKEDIDGKKEETEITEWKTKSRNESGDTKKESVQTLAEDGLYKLRMYVTDMAGNVSHAERQLIIDKENPVIAHVDELDGKYLKKFSWNYSIEESIKDFTNYTYVMKVDDAFYRPGEKIEKEGVHVLTIEAFDSAGN